MSLRVIFCPESQRQPVRWLPDGGRVSKFHVPIQMALWVEMEFYSSQEGQILAPWTLERASSIRADNVAQPSQGWGGITTLAIPRQIATVVNVAVHHRQEKCGL